MKTEIVKKSDILKNHIVKFKDCKEYHDYCASAKNEYNSQDIAYGPTINSEICWTWAVFFKGNWPDDKIVNNLLKNAGLDMDNNKSFLYSDYR